MEREGGGGRGEREGERGRVKALDTLKWWVKRPPLKGIGDAS